MEKIFDTKDIRYYIAMYNAQNHSRQITGIYPTSAKKFIEQNVNGRNYCIGKLDLCAELIRGNIPYQPVSSAQNNYVRVGLADNLFYCSLHNKLFFSCVIEIFYHDCCELYCNNSQYILIIDQERLVKSLLCNQNIFRSVKNNSVICPEVGDKTTVEIAIISYHNCKINVRLRGGLKRHPLYFNEDKKFVKRIKSSDMIDISDYAFGVCAEHGLRVDDNCAECVRDIAGLITMNNISDDCRADDLMRNIPDDVAEVNEIFAESAQQPAKK